MCLTGIPLFQHGGLLNPWRLRIEHVEF
jgi:hypothetical protein